jgi:predicted transposase YbfD/YdcC
MVAHLLGPLVRTHRAIENNLDWVMDMVFRDDECYVRTNHAPANFADVKPVAHNLLRQASGKNSLQEQLDAAIAQIPDRTVSIS